MGVNHALYMKEYDLCLEEYVQGIEDGTIKIPEKVEKAEAPEKEEAPENEPEEEPEEKPEEEPAGDAEEEAGDEEDSEA